MNPKPDYPDLRIRILKKLKFELKHSIARFSNKSKNCQTFIKMLIQEVEDKKKFRFLRSQSENEMISGSKVVFHLRSLQKPMK